MEQGLSDGFVGRKSWEFERLLVARVDASCMKASPLLKKFWFHWLRPFLSAAAIVLPILWQLRKREVFVQRGVAACSVIVALAGSYWFVQRVWLG